MGRVDVLAIDRDTGQYLLVELRKGHVAGKVSRQPSRTWPGEEDLAKDTDGDGMIVGFESDDTLRAARDAHLVTKTALAADDAFVTMRHPETRR